MSRFQAVIFDLDGTLLDTLEDLAASMNWVLQQNGCPVHPVDAYRYFVGDGMEMLARRAVPPERNKDLFVARCMAQMRVYYDAHWADKSAPYGGVVDLLQRLHEAGLSLNVLSNKPDEFTCRCVDRLLPGEVFDIVRGVRPDCPRKPDPQGALRIAERLGVDPPEVLYVGDTNVDMKTANRAGMYAVGVLWGFREEEELREHGAREIVARPAELLPLAVNV